MLTNILVSINHQLSPAFPKHLQCIPTTQVKAMLLHLSKAMAHHSRQTFYRRTLKDTTTNGLSKTISLIRVLLTLLHTPAPKVMEPRKPLISRRIRRRRQQQISTSRPTVRLQLGHKLCPKRLTLLKPMLDPNATPTPTAAHLVSAPQAPSNPPASTSHDNATNNKPELYLAWDDWDFDFDGAIWPKSNEPVDPNLSLGVIIWHPAKQMTRALPATFDEAEEQSLRPVPEKLGNGESVSIYFTADNSHEAFLDVRQTDAWEYIQSDPAFVVFTDEEMQHNLVPVEECIAQRDRPDEPLNMDLKGEDAEMREADWSVMDHLEQVLSASGEDSKPIHVAPELELAKAHATQEDILAALGVTGSPKPWSREPMSFTMPTPDQNFSVPLPEKSEVSLQPSGPPRLPVEPQRSQLLDGPRPIGHPAATQQQPYGSDSSSRNARPPPPPPPGQERYDPWNPTNRQQQYHPNGFNGGRGSPARSEASNGTAAGSDFETEKPPENNGQAITSGPNLERSDSSVSRKRSYGDTYADDDGLRQHDDHTKRKRRSQVDAAYR
ncbi:hypothetical protein N0V94_002227 [Neodidymelliopsis sp. IMI 364377]|nr:hypothetical protein N0V94_002227 [Neodidymelliopsis sp. IMI 364377]